MDINVVTSLVGAGLEREYLLLRELLMAAGHYVNGMHYTNINAPMVRADITISLEVIMPQALCLSRHNWFFPNSEWYDPKNDRFLPQISKIICKTKDCYDIWCRKVGPEKCVYTSFEARDIYKPEISREVKCLHVAGKSEYKNTEAVLRAYRMTRLQHFHPLPHLTVIARAPIFESQFAADAPFPDNNVTRIAKATDEEIVQLMNSHEIHVIPSMYEGFGHVIHEGLGCGALVLTTNAPPMNTYDGIVRECLMPPYRSVPRSLAQMQEVSYMAVNDSIRKAMELRWSHPDKAAECSKRARAAFLENKAFFREKFMGLVNSVQK